MSKAQLYIASASAYAPAVQTAIVEPPPNQPFKFGKAIHREDMLQLAKHYPDALAAEAR